MRRRGLRLPQGALRLLLSLSPSLIGACGWGQPAQTGMSASGALAQLCGNGTKDAAAGETCDGDCPATCADERACTIDSIGGTPSECNVVCVHEPQTECIDDDDCCPSGCDFLTDSDCSSSCGDGLIDPAQETCDPPEACPETCDDDDACTQDLATGSAASCSAECVFEPIVDCDDGDGCCPAGCAHQDNDCVIDYPTGPYCEAGRSGCTVENFKLEECICSGETLVETRDLWADQLYQSGATLLFVATTDCPYCRELAEVIDGEFNTAELKARGLRTLYVFGEDNRQRLVREVCPFADAYKMGSTMVAMDVGEVATGKYGDGVPQTLLLDSDMLLVYTEIGWDGRYSISAYHEEIEQILP